MGSPGAPVVSRHQDTKFHPNSLQAPTLRQDSPTGATVFAAPSLASEGAACVVLWASGGDTRADSILRIAAIRRSEGGEWQTFERHCAPRRVRGRGPAGSAAPEENAGLSRRVRGEFGVNPADLIGAPDAREVWGELRDFVGARPVLTNDGSLLAAWSRALDLESGVTLPPWSAVGIDEVAVLIEPGHLSTLGSARLVETLLGAELAPRPPGALHPPQVLAALAELIARFHALGGAVHAVCAFAWRKALEPLGGTDPEARVRLALATALVDRPSLWAGDTELFAPGRLDDRVLSGADVDSIDADDPLAILSPRVADLVEDLKDETPLGADVDGDAPFHPEDLARLDELFREHLPQLFAKTTARPASSLYRESQHRVAEEVARCLGSDELLLVHAPTGTGKTLAYLLPALMWARRYGVRVGVATYTRALQSQAMEREVPRAIEALRRAGLPAGFRVSMLKGREHSLCWRSLRLHAPIEGDDPEAWLAWCALALFGLRDGDGDLDRFPRRSPVRFTASAPYRRALASLVAHARARSGCCRAIADRATCAAEAARRRAERSHVVLTNQSFALARPEFFRRVVFDECEHLHDQAMSAWSHRVSFTEVRRVLNRLHDPGGNGGGSGRRRAPLDRLRNRLPVGSGASDRLAAALVLWSHAMNSLARLESSVLEYERWRAVAARGRPEAELHGLFREYVETQGIDAGGRSGELVDARLDLVGQLGRLDASLAQLAEELMNVKVPRAARARRTLELARTALDEMGEALAAWLPIDEGVPRFGGSMFHDVERNVRDEVVLSALVLLPGDALGRFYYPELGSAAFVSATTRLGGSFEPSKGYLGLDRVAEIDAETGEVDRTAGTRRVTSFHAPEVFDYERVLVGLPRGLPAVQTREPYLDFLARYLPWYAERTRGRMLCLFTSLRDVREVAERAGPRFEAAGLPLLWQGMEAAGKEELSALFRERVEATLFGVDTFWYGADFPGETLETLVMARLPYGVPDRYHHAQCAAIGVGAQRKRIYMPRALAKFRQGFGRLMRTSTDRGVVLVLDSRITERRHGSFLSELPVARPGSYDPAARARMARGDIDVVSREAFAHLGVLADMERRGLGSGFSPPLHVGAGMQDPREGGREPGPAGRDEPLQRAERRRVEPERIEVDEGELPF